MVEELIAEGYTPAQVMGILIADYGASPADAALIVSTALGGTGDVVVEELDELVPPGAVEEPEGE
jgi:hypothetical protein